MGQPRVLLIDDDRELCALVREYLGEEGFEVQARHRPVPAVEEACSGQYQLVVLDVMLPEINGFEALRRIRSRCAVPVLMLTARGEEVDRIVGLEIGADDYLPKPFNPRELMARIRAVLRRAGGASEAEPAERLEVGDVQLYRPARTVTCSGEAVELTAVQFDLLAELLQSAGQVLPREDLSRQVLGREFRPYDRSLDVHVSHLRRKLGPNPDGSERIRSVRGVGYLYTRPASGD